MTNIFHHLSPGRKQAFYNFDNGNDTGNRKCVPNNSHPPLISQPVGIYDLMEDDDLVKSKKFVKVRSIGQVEMQPDIVEFCVKITATKIHRDQAKESIAKRENFVMTALQKLKIPKSHIHISSIVKRIPSTQKKSTIARTVSRENLTKAAASFLRTKLIEQEAGDHSDATSVELPQFPEDNNEDENPDNSDTKLLFITEICVKCSRLSHYIKLCSICNEKLDHRVKISAPEIRFSVDAIQKAT